jgi:ankyrin repeat protein
VRLLLDAGASIDTIGGKYGTVLQLAALNTSENVVHLLLDRGADVNIHAGYFGNALQAWSYVGNQDIVQLILDKGADPNARGGFYETALIAAVHGGHESIIELLLNSGAEVGIISTSFGSALDHVTRLVRDNREEEDMYERYKRVIQLLTNFEHNLEWSP